MDIVNSIIQDVVSIGGVSIPRNKAIILQVMAGVGKYQTMRKNGVNYQVTAGKTLKILAFRGASLATNNYMGTISYGDTAVDNSSGAPTNNVVLQDGSATYYAVMATSSIYFEVPIYKEVPAGKYPCILGIGNDSYITFLCVEE